MMLAALSVYHAGISQIVIAGDRSAEETRALTDVVRRRYMPFAVIVPLGTRDPGSGVRDQESVSSTVARLLPWTDAMTARTGSPTAYVCRNFACLTPATTAEEFASQLRQADLKVRLYDPTTTES
jgi:uncharacterized protein YyaL (SSP411 family)